MVLTNNQIFYLLQTLQWNIWHDIKYFRYQYFNQISIIGNIYAIFINMDILFKKNYCWKLLKWTLKSCFVSPGTR